MQVRFRMRVSVKVASLDSYLYIQMLIYILHQMSYVSKQVQ